MPAAPGKTQEKQGENIDTPEGSLSAASCGVLEPSVWHRAIGAVHSPVIGASLRKEGDMVSILYALIELLGETMPILLTNASQIGALLFQIRAWFDTKRK